MTSQDEQTRAQLQVTISNMMFAAIVSLEAESQEHMISTLQAILQQQNILAEGNASMNYAQTKNDVLCQLWIPCWTIYARVTLSLKYNLRLLTLIHIVDLNI